jgi:hypothetical protein
MDDPHLDVLTEFLRILNMNYEETARLTCSSPGESLSAGLSLSGLTLHIHRRPLLQFLQNHRAQLRNAPRSQR